MVKKKKIVEKVVVPVKKTEVLMPEPIQPRRCLTCIWVKYGMCPFYGELKDGGDLTIQDNGCLRHRYEVKGNEF